MVCGDRQQLWQQHRQPHVNFHETALGQFNLHETALGRFHDAVAAADAVVKLGHLL